MVRGSLNFRHLQDTIYFRNKEQSLLMKHKQVYIQTPFSLFVKPGGVAPDVKITSNLPFS